MADLTPDVDWYRDLRRGAGDAARLPPDLRNALGEVLEDRATEIAASRRAAVVAAQQREREERRATRAAASRGIVSGAFGSLLVRMIIGAVLIGGTLVVGSFITISPIGDNFRPVFFFGGETGSTANDGPGTLAVLLATVVITTVLVMFVADLVFGGVDSFPGLAIWGAVVGLAIFIAQWSTDTLSAASWWIAPMVMTAGYLATSVRTGQRGLLAAADPTARRGRDGLAIAIPTLLMISGIVPWWIGLQVRDTDLLPTAPGVFDTSVRSAADYGAAQVLIGLLPLGILLAVAALLVCSRRRPRFAAVTVIVGLTIALIGGITGRSTWDAAEARSTQRYAETNYQLMECPTGCGSVADEVGSPLVRWSVVLDGSNVTAYRAWIATISIDLDPLLPAATQTYLLTAPEAEPLVASSMIIVRQENDVLTGYTLADGAKVWASSVISDTGRDPAVVSAALDELRDTGTGAGVVVLEADAVSPGAAVAISAGSGKVAWAVSCPAGEAMTRDVDWMSLGYVQCTGTTGSTYYRVLSTGVLE